MELYQLALIALLILINGFLVGVEVAFISLRRSRLRQLVKEGSKRALLVDKLLADPGTFFSAIQIGVTLAAALASATAALDFGQTLASWLEHLGLRWHPLPIAVFVVTVAFSYVIIVLGEIVPKRISLRQSEFVALRYAPIVAALVAFCYPFARALAVSSSAVIWALGGGRRHEVEPIGEEELRVLLEEHRSLPEEEKRIMGRVIDLGHANVRGVMRPRPDVVAVEDTETVGRAKRLIQTSGNSRLPVYHEDLDDVVGIVVAKDVLAVAEKDEGRPVLDFVRPTIVLPESLQVVQAFRRMQKDRHHIAIVVDEHGGAEGIITLEDIIEEIMGEIQDEYDREEADVSRVGKDEAIIDASASVREVNRMLGAAIPESDDYDTLAGFILAKTGAVPKVGQTASAPPFDFEVVKVDRRRIVKVRARRTAQPQRPG
jgi:putative hemolysin